MKIENTALTYEEEDKIALEYFMGEDTETFESWAKRVWSLCEQSELGIGVPRVYKRSSGQTWQERAVELWTNKKMKRKLVLLKMFNETSLSKQTFQMIKNKKEYLTRDQRKALENG